MSGVMSCHLAAHYVLSALKERDLSASPLKLIKLVYISHGYHLAFHKKPLLREHVEAWRYGPVIPEIYYAVKEFKGAPVPLDLFAGYLETAEAVGPESPNLVKEVIAAYGKFDGLQLSAATHKDGTPWHTVYRGKGDRAVIPNSLIQEYYEKLATQ